MTVQTTDGSCVRISTDTPVAYSAADYQSLDYEPLGQIVSFGGLSGFFADVTSYDLGQGEIGHYKGSFDYNAIPIVIDLDESDAGQAILADHHDGAKTYSKASFEVTLPNGIKTYWIASVYEFATEDLAQDAIYRANISIRVVPSSVVKVPSQALLLINGEQLLMNGEAVTNSLGD